MGHLLGYARVSTAVQSADPQTDQSGRTYPAGPVPACGGAAGIMSTMAGAAQYINLSRLDRG